MNPILLLIASTIILAVLAMTLRWVKRYLTQRRALEVPFILIAFFDLLEWFLWTACLLALIAAAPHPVTLVLIALLIVSIATAHRLRYREERRSLNRWLRMAPETGLAVPELLETLADGCRSRLARQAKACSKRLHRGEPIADAARRAKFPLDADTLAAITTPVRRSASGDDSAGPISFPDPSVPLHTEDESSRSMALAFQQFTYVVATMFLAWLIGMLVRSHLIPMFDHLYDGMPFAGNPAHDGLDAVTWIGHVLMTLFLAWLLSAAILRWMPLWMTGCVPWFGRKAIDQWRCEVLRTLERGMRIGQAEGQILQCASQSTRVRWIRSRCRRAFRLVESGTPLCLAMQSGKLVSAREQVWLTCAEKNGNLPDAMKKLNRDIQRRQTHRWKIRMAWFVPLATILVGIFVLAHTMFLFYFLYGLIAGMA